MTVLSPLTPSQRRALRAEQWLMLLFPVSLLLCAFPLPGLHASSYFVIPRMLLLGLHAWLLGALLLFRPKGGSPPVASEVKATVPLIVVLMLAALFAPGVAGFSAALHGGHEALGPMLISLQGEMWRGTGVLWAALLLFVYMLHRQSRVSLQRGWLLALATVSLLTIIEFLGFEPFFWLNRFLSYDPPVVTLVNRGWLAGLLLTGMVYLAAAPLRLDCRRLPWRQALPMLLLCGLALGCTTNTSALIAGLLAVGMTYVVGRPNLGKCCLVAVCVAAGLSAQVYLKPVNLWLYEHHWVARKINVKSLGDTRSWGARLDIWAATGQLITQRPVLGWGMGRFGEAINFFTPDPVYRKLIQLELPQRPIVAIKRPHVFFYDEHGKLTAQSVNYPSAHNALLDLLFEAGGLGLLAFLWAAYAVWRSFRRTEDWMLRTAPFMAYGLYLMAWFTVLPVTTLVLLLLADELNALPDE